MPNGPEESTIIISLTFNAFSDVTSTEQTGIIQRCEVQLWVKQKTQKISFIVIYIKKVKVPYSYWSLGGVLIFLRP